MFDYFSSGEKIYKTMVEEDCGSRSENKQKGLIHLSRADGYQVQCRRFSSKWTDNLTKTRTMTEKSMSI